MLHRSIDAVDYYLRLNYSSKLGIKTLTAEEVREKSRKYKRVCTKEFKIKLQVINKEDGIKIQRKTVRLPQNIQLRHCAAWFMENNDHDALEVSCGDKRFSVESEKHRAKIESFITNILSGMGLSRNPNINSNTMCVTNSLIPVWIFVDARDVLKFTDEDILAQFPKLSEIDLANA